MVRQAVVLLAIAAEQLALPPSDRAKQAILALFGVHGTLHHEILLAIENVVHVHGLEIALRQSEVVNGIEQVGLAHAIGPHKAVHLGAQHHFGLPVIAEVQKVQFGEVERHGNACEVRCVKVGLRQVP